ncbi:sphingolipid delta(4)-desaturase/C4-monooxygenase DES2-like [Hippocampus zosterae]|uniref:sphingolipid delta(4)-desaturase/C4-monooxygenase DES2-like n=1 Tax=Hippocampus zosterae TaxID=109293 RepID=UPI00223D153A|nr:sphingolipid delta(4)-desaturase/C4-monooxygenase DES2-like [Hippocampus zosterae]
MALDFNYTFGPEAHYLRRRRILEVHPEVSLLMEKSWFGYLTYPLLCALVLGVQLGCAWLVRDAAWYVLLGVAYCVGGTINHTQFVLMHDLTHFTAFESITMNKLWAIFVNMPTGIPSAIAFGKHHADHHRYLGVKGLDPDIATEGEVQLVERSWVKKLLFGTFLFVPYGLRPLFVHPKPPCALEVLNIVTALGFDLCVGLTLGVQAACYIVLSTLISMSVLHPCTLHILAEHYEYVPGMDTFDYLGPLNYPNLNMGYHIEHHDFPMIPWFNLPRLRAAAPEFYEPFPVHTSYLRMLLRFVFDRGIALCTRTVRKQPLQM